MRELELVNETNDPRFAISFSVRKEGFRRGLKQKLHQAREGVLHDTMSIGGGISPFKVIMWKFMGQFFHPCLIAPSVILPATQVN